MQGPVKTLLLYLHGAALLHLIAFENKNQLFESIQTIINGIVENLLLRDRKEFTITTQIHYIDLTYQWAETIRTIGHLKTA